MKKIFALILALTALLAFSSCGGNSSDEISSLAGSLASVAGESSEVASEVESGSSIPAGSSSNTTKDNFVAPANYACVLGVSINPQFDLYLDTDENVLKIHALNTDAKSFEKQINLSDNDLDDVIESIMKLAKNKGFLKESAPNVSLDLHDVKNQKVDEADVLEDASEAVKDAGKDLKLNISVKISITQASNNSQKPSTSLGDKEQNQDDSSEVHVCLYSPANCTTPATCACGKTSGKALGHMWDEATCKAPKTCHICKVTDGEKGAHKYEGSKCTVCGAASYLNPKTDLKLTEEYVAQKYYVYDETTVDAPGICFYNDGGFGEGVYCLMLDAMFTSEPDTDIKNRTPITYNGKKYYRCGAGQSPAYVELTDTEIIINYNPDTIKLVLMTDGNLKVTSSTKSNYPVGTVLSINWNYLK